MYDWISRENIKTDSSVQSMPISRDTPKTADSNPSSERLTIKSPFKMDSFTTPTSLHSLKLYAWKYLSTTQTIQTPLNPNKLLSLRSHNPFPMNLSGSTCRLLLASMIFERGSCRQYLTFFLEIPLFLFLRLLQESR